MSAHRAKPGSLVADEPVVVGHTALLAVSWAGEYLVGRTHLVSPALWPAVAAYLVPLVTAALVALSAVLMRRVVTPAAKAAQRVEDAAVKALGPQGAALDLPSVTDALSAAGKVLDTIVEAAPIPTVPAVVPVRDPYASPGPVGSP